MTQCDNCKRLEHDFEGKMWTAVQENLLKDWAEKARYYSWMHNKAHLFFSSMDARLTIPLICVSTISGSANFTMVGNTGTSTMHLVVFPLTMGILSISTALLSAMSKYMKSSELSAKHLVFYKNYNALFRNISLELSISPDQRRYANLSMNEYRNDLDRLLAEAPTIPDSIITLFNISFPYVKNKPEIAHTFEKINIYGRNSLLRTKEDMLSKIRNFYRLKYNIAMSKKNKPKEDDEFKTTFRQTENQLYCDNV